LYTQITHVNKLFYHHRIRLSHPPHHDNTTCIWHHAVDSAVNASSGSIERS